MDPAEAEFLSLSLVRLLQQAFVCCVRRRERWFHFDILAYIYYMCVCVFVHISTPPTTTTTTTILLLRVACFEPRKEKKRGSLLAVAAACCWCRVVCCRMSVVASSSFLSLSYTRPFGCLLGWKSARKKAKGSAAAAVETVKIGRLSYPSADKRVLLSQPFLGLLGNRSPEKS